MNLKLSKSNFSIFNVYQKMVTPFYFESMELSFYRLEAFVSGFYFDLINQNFIMVFDLELNKKFHIMSPAFFNMSQNRFGSIVGNQLYRKFLVKNSYTFIKNLSSSNLSNSNFFYDYFPFLNHDFILQDLYKAPFELSDEAIHSTSFFSKFDFVYKRSFVYSNFEISVFNFVFLKFS